MSELSLIPFTVIVKKLSNYINREPFPIFLLSQVELLIDEGFHTGADVDPVWAESCA